MDVSALRHLLLPLVVGLKDTHTHTQLPDVCERLGMPAPPAADEGSKADRMRASFDAVSDDDLAQVAQRLLLSFPPDASRRNTIQDILWTDTPYPTVPKRFRRELAQALSPDDLFLDGSRFDELLDRLWVLDDGSPFDEVFGTNRNSLRAQIEQHVHRNPGDWEVEHLFDQLGVFDASTHRFGLFLEGLASAEVRPSVESQQRFVSLANAALQACGVELRETGESDGYPTFELVSTRQGNAGRPKNLIFASPSKPDIRLRDAVNNDIEVASNADTVLIYDRAIGTDGVSWNDLQDWWADAKQLADPEEAKRSLFRRLRQSLPANSPPQVNLFEQYFRCFQAAIPRLPALMPEVWLHWDPKTVEERGAEALLRFRMDFLMLLPRGVRVVIEVDGKRHYADDSGLASPAAYSRLTSADRDLKLAGYEVFRFGATELSQGDWKSTVDAFFRSLFKHYSVPC